MRLLVMFFVYWFRFICRLWLDYWSMVWLMVRLWLMMVVIISRFRCWNVFRFVNVWCRIICLMVRLSFWTVFFVNWSMLFLSGTVSVMMSFRVKMMLRINII